MRLNSKLAPLAVASLSLLLSLPVAGCGDESSSSEGSSSSNNGGSGDSDRGGPESLKGYTWTSAPVEVNGIQLQLAFEFTDDEVIALNTCNGSETVQTSAPVRYTYSAQIPSGDSTTVEAGGATCFVSVDAAEFDFEIVDGNLQISYGQETLLASPSGGTAGLYGTWVVETEVSTLSFQMGNGKLVSSNACNNGLTASVTVDANYENFVVIEEEAVNETDTCSVGIAAGTLEYSFEGDTLVMEQDGQSFRFER